MKKSEEKVYVESRTVMPAFCTICADLQESYARGLRDAADWLEDRISKLTADAMRIDFALKDRGAKEPSK